MGVPDASDSRLEALRGWVWEDLGFEGCRIESASADASFRRYFRVTRGEDSYIIMDAPPDKEDVAPFVTVARALSGIGLNAPLVLAQDPARGFLLLSDLGARHYLDELRVEGAVDRLYADATAALVVLQTAGDAAAAQLPLYDRALLVREMELLPEWFLGRHLQSPVERAVREMLDRTFVLLADAALEQPTTFVHRDYHSRNLLVDERRNPGIIDFQDAVRGPVTYDAVSLLKDCYIAWPPARVRGWLEDYRESLLRAGFAQPLDAATFARWFDWMGLQRHIKVLGIFARLYYRDGKSGYLKDLPRVLDYTEAAAAAYPELSEFAEFIAAVVRPRFAAAQARLGA